jgi:PII-like signaling protein
MRPHNKLKNGNLCPRDLIADQITGGANHLEIVQILFRSSEWVAYKLHYCPARPTSWTHTMAEWLLLNAQGLGLHGATLMGAGEGFGYDGKLHSAYFFELSDQPIEVAIAVTGKKMQSGCFRV